MTPARVRWMLSLDDEDKERFSAAVDALVLANVLMRFEDKLAAPSWDVASEYLEKHRVHPSHLAGNIRRANGRIANGWTASQKLRRLIQFYLWHTH